MTGPRDREQPVPTCMCGHNLKRHQLPGFDGECVADGCGCRGFHARTPLVTPARTAERNGLASTLQPTIENLVKVGRNSPIKRTAALANRIAIYADELLERLRNEQLSTRHEAAAAQARARLAAPFPAVPPLPADTRASAVSSGDHACTRPDCTRSFATPQARAMHERRAHDGFNPHAASAARREHPSSEVAS